jgi:metallo-beta-lactamase superfamily protein
MSVKAMRARPRPEERTDMPQKPSPEGIVALDELEILVVVDNETDTLSSVDEGVPQIPEVVHLAARLPPSRKYDGHECKTVFDQLCCACHGRSVLITGRSGGQRHRLLFEVGPYPDLWLENARRLAIDLSTIEYILLSHWHFDHSGGLPGVIAAIGKARLAAGLAQPFVDLHPDRPDQRCILLSGGPMIMLPQEPIFEDIRQAGERDKVFAILPEEVRDTANLYLDRKIDQWYSQQNGKGVVFILNVTDLAAAHEMLEKLPLGQANLMSFKLIPLGPLAPLRRLTGMDTKPSQGTIIGLS